MICYAKMYGILFNAVTDAVNALSRTEMCEEICSGLKKAQQQSEELYLAAGDVGKVVAFPEKRGWKGKN